MANQPSNMRAADVAVTHSETKLTGFRLISQGQVRIWKAMLVGVFFAGFVGALTFAVGVDQGQNIPQPQSEAAVLRGITPIPFPKQIKGDVNYDGRVTIADSLIIQSYLNGLRVPIDSRGALGEELTPDQKDRADVNMDAKVSHIDVVLISQYSVGVIRTLPIRPTVYGDVNCDNKATVFDALLIATFEQSGTPPQPMKCFVNADVNGDSMVTKLDALLVAKSAVGLIKLPVFPTLFGDVTGDGQVNSADAYAILVYVENDDNSQLKKPENGDVNLDGRITKIDFHIVAQYSVGLVKSLPAPATLYGDADGNGLINMNDVLRIATYVEKGDATVIKNFANSDAFLESAISMQDANIIAEYLVGLKEKLPVCPTQPHGCLVRPLFTPKKGLSR